MEQDGPAESNSREAGDALAAGKNQNGLKKQVL